MVKNAFMIIQMICLRIRPTSPNVTFVMRVLTTNLSSWNTGKKNHPETVPQCNTVKEGKICQFGDICGFGHEPLDNQQLPQTHVPPDVSGPTENPNTTSAEQNFCKGQKIIKQHNQIEEMKLMMERMMMEIHQMKQKLNK